MKNLVEVNLMCAEIIAIRGSTFSYCVALTDVWLPPKLQKIGKEAFLCCTSLKEIVIPPKLRYIGARAFCGCEQLEVFTKLDGTDAWRAERNAFLMCSNSRRESWIKLLPQPQDPDSDCFDDIRNLS